MKCKCGQTAVHLRATEGRHYCSACLSRQVEKRFKKELGKSCIRKGETIAVGVSGGKDSMVLLHLMNKFAGRLAKIIVVTVDEGIRGYRDRSIESVEGFVKELGVEHRIFSFEKELGFEMDNLKGKDVRFCTYCGVFRRYLLNKAARQLGASKLAVGHNLDDEAQSVLMNVLRGDMGRMRRLSQLSRNEKLVPRIKPLKNIPEKEIVAYAVINNIPYFDGECPNSFDNVRRDVQTMLNEMEQKYPGTKHNIVNFYKKLKLAGEEGIVGRCIRCGEPTSHETCKACELVEKIKRN